MPAAAAARARVEAAAPVTFCEAIEAGAGGGGGGMIGGGDGLEKIPMRNPLTFKWQLTAD